MITHSTFVMCSHTARGWRIMVLWLSYNFLLCNFGLFTNVSLLICCISHDFYNLTHTKNRLQNKPKQTVWQKLTQFRWTVNKAFIKCILQFSMLKATLSRGVKVLKNSIHKFIWVGWLIHCFVGSIFLGQVNICSYLILAYKIGVLVK